MDDIQATLDIVLDRLNDLEAKIDNQSSDLKGVTQNWDKKLDSTNSEANGCNSDRFTCLWPDENGEPTAVRDNETGLVWERAPHTDRSFWADAIRHCANLEVGGRRGWHLPLLEQMESIIDSSNQDPALPSGHPFINFQLDNYWSATTAPETPRLGNDHGNRRWQRGGQ